MKVGKRKAISTKMRFEIFKRDGFACQYCGANPPQAILHVDHILAIANGGDNDQDNLITACDVCNLGKGARLLSQAPLALKEKAALIKERERQIIGYQQVMAQRRERLESEAWAVCAIIEPTSPRKGMRKDRFQSVKSFIEKLGFDCVIEAAEITAANALYLGQERKFRYFCGVCWNRVREGENGPRS